MQNNQEQRDSIILAFTKAYAHKFFEEDFSAKLESSEARAYADRTLCMVVIRLTMLERTKTDSMSIDQIVNMFSEMINTEFKLRETKEEEIARKEVINIFLNVAKDLG